MLIAESYRVPVAQNRVSEPQVRVCCEGVVGGCLTQLGTWAGTVLFEVWNAVAGCCSGCCLFARVVS